MFYMNSSNLSNTDLGPIEFCFEALSDCLGDSGKKCTLINK